MGGSCSPSAMLRKFAAKRRSSNIAPGGRDPPQKKTARVLRQGESDYRCCIPALAEFVNSQSIAPDGEKISPQDRRRATTNDEAQMTNDEGTLKRNPKNIRVSPHLSRVDRFARF